MATTLARQAATPDPAAVATLADAMQLDPYAALMQLHRTSVARQITPAPGVEQLVRELALASAVQQIWLRLQPRIMHRALLAGATVEEVAAAVGVSPRAAAAAWLRWARRQAEHTDRVGLDPADELTVTWAQVHQVVRSHPELWPAGVA